MARILIVDDHIETCRVMTMLVKHLGHEGHSVFSGPEAMQHLARHATDLVILDIMMPGMDGLEVLRQLRAQEKTRKTPVIMMTAVTDPLIKRNALSLGANDYWIKATIEVSELDRRIKQHALNEPPGGQVQRVVDGLRSWVTDRLARSATPRLQPV